MARRVKDIAEINEYIALDALIERLQIIRASLCDWASPQVGLRGDDFFGHRLTITFLREQTKEEAALEKKYSASVSRRRSSRPARPPRATRPGREASQVRQTLRRQH